VFALDALTLGRKDRLRAVFSFTGMPYVFQSPARLVADFLQDI
jgi:hypothetical protein